MLATVDNKKVRSKKMPIKYKLGRHEKVKSIKSPYAGTCRCCGVTIDAGASRWFCGDGRGLRCKDCGPHPADSKKWNGQVDQEGLLNPRSTSAAPKKPKTDTLGDLKREFNIASTGCRREWSRISCDHRIHFDNMQSLLAYALDQDFNLNTEEDKRMSSYINDNSGSRFLEGKTTADILTMTTEANSKDIKTILKLKDEITMEACLTAKPTRRMRRGLDCGDNIDVDKFATGDPFMWERMERINPISTGTIRIGINAAVHWRQSRRHLYYRGALALALADHLQASGRSVEICLYKLAKDSFQNCRRAYVSSVIVKQATQPMDWPSLIASCCEISFVRGIMLSTYRGIEGKLKSSLGRTTSLEDLPKTIRESVNDECDYFIDNDITSRKKAIDTLANLNLNLKPKVGT